MSLESIDEAMGIERSVQDIEVIPPSGIVEKPKTEMSVVSVSPEADKQEDYEFVRDTLRKTIEGAADGLEEVMLLAKESESPRAFEVAANLAKSIADISKNLMELHKNSEKVAPPPMQPIGPVTQINNTVFTGTTAELLDHLKGIKTIN